MTKRLGETAEILLHFYNTPVIIPGDNTVYVQPDIFLEKYAGCANLTFDKEPFYEDVTRQNIILGHTIGIGFEAANGFQPCSDELFELALFLEPLA
jgi:hypothetical protein